MLERTPLWGDFGNFPYTYSVCYWRPSLQSFFDSRISIGGMDIGYTIKNKNKQEKTNTYRDTFFWKMFTNLTLRHMIIYQYLHHCTVDESVT